jgi:hypothetical protein
MAVAECPNCKHDIQTPDFRFFRGGENKDKGWKDFHCPYCRAKLKKKRQKWAEFLAVPVGLLIAMGVPHQYFKHVDFYAPIAALVLSLFTLSRPKLQVVGAPNNPANDLEQRQSEKLSESFPGRDLEAGRARNLDRSANLNFLRLR